MPETSRLPSVVLADTDTNSVISLRAQVERLDYLVHVVDKPARLNSLVKRVQPAALLIDVNFGNDAFRLVRNLHEQGLSHCMSIIFLAFRPDAREAVEAMRLSAEDYLAKPVSQTQLAESLLKSVPYQSDQPAFATGGEYFSGRSEAMTTLRQQLQKVAPTDATVLISSETGSGAHEIARQLHRASGRRSRPFVTVDTSSWRGQNAMAVEISLFGHEKGILPGTNLTRTGACSRANGGTLFIDEIGDLEPAHQSMLLRFLRDRQSRAVGSSETTDIDVRVVAASRYATDELETRQDLKELLFELNVVCLVVPPLRERRQDIADLAKLLCRRFAQQHGRADLRLGENVLSELAKRWWPGNVRELSNLLEKVVVLSDGKSIDDLPREEPSPTFPAEKPSVFHAPVAQVGLDECSESLSVMDQLKVQAIQTALERANGHVGKAAKILGMGQATLYRKLRHFGIRRPGRPERISNQRAIVRETEEMESSS